MTELLKIDLPLQIDRVRSKPYILNLNVYRNTHYRTLNGMKKSFKKLISQEMMKLKPISDTKLHAEYKYYRKDKRKIDVSNPCSVIDKFAMDALVEHGVIQDDNCTIICSVAYIFGGIDKENPRCELRIFN